MLQFVLHKIKNKKWLTTCLVLGLTFLVAAVSCQPMFKNGSLNKMLFDAFAESAKAQNVYPAVIGRSGSYATEKRPTVAKVEEGIDGYRNTWEKYLSDVPVVCRQTMLTLPKESCQGSMGSRGSYLTISYMPDMLSHAEILTGCGYDVTDVPEDVYPAMLSESVMDAFHLTVGETLNFVNCKDEDGKTPKLFICGIFRESESTDLYWYMQPNACTSEVFVPADAFDDIVKRFGSEKIYYSTYELLDYAYIDAGNVDDVEYYLEQFHAEDKNFYDSFSGLLTQYNRDKQTVSITLWVLSLPMLGLVLAFIYMVASQIIETEKGEIAMMRSRGYRRKKIVGIYTLQAAVLSLVAIIIGLPASYGLCKLAASTTDFLTFRVGNLSMYTFTPWMLLYGGVAALAGIVCILIPVIANAGVSIVQQKSDVKINRKMFWEKYFLDVLLLVVSLYLLYNFNREMESIRDRALLGTKMDPLIFLDSVLFIGSMGLVVLRLLRYLVKLIYRIGKKRWQPASYASFLQITRNFRKQSFISLFLILTVALGLFNANAARTINRNHENRIYYETGADVTFQEKWEMRIFGNEMKGIEKDYEYIEPDFVKYESLVSDGLCSNVTKVIRTDNTVVRKGKQSVPNCEMMGIHTKQFGEIANMQEELNRDVHWYTYLNELAKTERGVIISRNLAETLEVQVGDSIDCSLYGAVTFKADEVRGELYGQVVAIVDAWPGFCQYTYEDGTEIEHFLVVANYAKMIQSYKMLPYEIWCKLADGVSPEQVEAKLSDMQVELIGYESVSERIAQMKESAMIRITNGMFTLSFLVAIILCMIGFLIYWISSIRQRELLFGVYRAMGMSEKEINRMLVNEHLFSTFPAILAGGICGGVATLLFVKLFGIIYLPQRHNLDILIYLDMMDVGKLMLVLAVMIVICMLILHRLVRNMNITQALKLGEE